MRPLKVIAGSGSDGKSGGGGHVPTEDADSLRSKQFARVIDLVSEGEIEGLVDGLRSIYLDGTPLQNDDGSFNFSGVHFDSRPGTQGQSYLPGFPAVEAEQVVGLEVKASVAVTRQFSNAALDAVRLTLSVPQLTHQDPSTGDLHGTTVEVAIDLQSNGGGFVAQPVGRRWSEGIIAVGESSAVLTTTTEAAKLEVTWAGTLDDPDPQACTYTLEKRTGAGAWTAVSTITHSGFSSARDDGNGGQIREPATGRSTIKHALSTASVWEFRLVKVSGIGAMRFTAGYGLVDATTDLISGKTTARYQRSYTIPLVGDPPWDIRVRRITADSAASNLSNKTFWETATEIIDTKLAYPNSALMALQVDAAQFRGVPRRGYDIRGIKVRVPSNYTPETRTYSGVWNGNFQIAWSDNPAWVLYDLLTAERYGLGDFIAASEVDKWALYDIAQYCDELVPDGFGGMEPRFTCNLFLQTREDAYRVIGNLAAIFRGMQFWSAGSITVGADKPADAIALFNPANVVDGVFEYQGVSRRARHTVALVAWNDPADQFKQKVEYVEDPDGIRLYGVVETELTAFGCTSRGQAHRLGRWLLYTERLETETVSFRAGLDGTVVWPGAVIQTTDPGRAGVRFGGRVVSATASAVALDAAVTIAPGKAYTLSVIGPSGAVLSGAVSNAPGSTTVLSLAAPLAETPQAWAVWVLAASDLQAEVWRVVAVSEPVPGQVEITALKHNASKYDAVEQDLILEIPPTSILSSVPVAPTGLSVTEALYLAAPGVIGLRAAVSWVGSAGATQYALRWRRDEGNWTEVRTDTTSIDLTGLEAGFYEFSLSALNALGARSKPLTQAQELHGKMALPSAPTGLSVVAVGGVAVASWAAHPDLDVQVGGVIVLRHAAATSGAAWEDGIVFDTVPGSATGAILPLITGTYLAKARDASGNWSSAAASFVATEAVLTGWTTVGTLTEHPAFSGAKTNTAAVDNILKLAGTETIGDQTDPIDSWGYVDNLGGMALAGSYDFAAALDLTTVAVRRLVLDIVALSYDADDLIDLRGEIDGWAGVDGSEINDCDATLYVRTTPDDPAGSPVWSDWTPFVAGDFNFRAAQFRLDLSTDNPSHNIDISTLRVKAQVPV